MWTSINKKLYIFICVIFLIGIIGGMFFVVMMEESTKEIIFLNINEFLQNFNNTNINGIIVHLIVLSSLLILSLLIIGAPILVFFSFFNGFSVGFIISSLTSIFGIKGFLYSLIYLVISKGLYLFLSLLFIVTLFKIIKLGIDVIVYKKKNDNISVYLKKCLVCIAIILINDIILYFWGTNIINIFNFLII